jgi:hypothetical protein
VGGGSLITVTAYWKVTQLGVADMAATIGHELAPIDNMLRSTIDGTRVVLRVPPAASPGVVTGVLTGSGGMRSEFFFEYFLPPEIFDVQPRTATLDGQVPPCSACLMYNDGATVSIWARNFPRVARIEDISVAFDSVVCGQGDCMVRYVENLADALYVAVSVPQAHSPRAVQISISYVGQPAPHQVFCRPPGICLCDFAHSHAPHHKDVCNHHYSLSAIQLIPCIFIRYDVSMHAQTVQGVLSVIDDFHVHFLTLSYREDAQSRPLHGKQRSRSLLEKCFPTSDHSRSWHSQHGARSAMKGPGACRYVC